MPNAPQFEWPQGEPLFETQWRAVTESLAGNGVLNNGDLALTAGTANREVDYAAGTVYYLGTEYTETAGSVTVSAGDANEDRWDTIAYDTATPGVEVKEGTPAANPEPPDVDGAEILLGVVYVPQNFDDVLASSQILNWISPVLEADSVPFTDASGDYGVDNVGAALDSVDLDIVRNHDNAITGQLADLGTNPGAFGALVDATVDGTPSQGTEESFTFSIDGTIVAKAYAEADGSGSVQFPKWKVPGGGLDVGDETFTGLPIMRFLRDAGLGGAGGQFDVTSNGDLDIEVRDFGGGGTQGRIRLLQSGGTELYQGLALDTGETFVDYTNKHVPRAQVDDHKATTTVSTSTYTTSDEEVVLVDTAAIAATSTITLASADAVDGNTIVVTDLTGSAGTYPITVDTEGTETIHGQSSKTIETAGGALVFTSDGTNWALGGGGAGGGGADPVEVFEGRESGNVAAGNQGVLVIDALADATTVEVYKAVLTTDTAGAVPTSVDLKLVTLDNAGGFTTQSTLITGDGSTIHDRVTGDPLGSYSNASGSEQTIGVLVDNQTTSGLDIMAVVEGETGL